MLFHFRSRLKKPESMSDAEFYAVWLEESKTSLEALESGLMKAIYKVPGRDEVIGIIEIDSADALDQGIHSLPIWKLGYQHLIQDIEWTVLRPYENWAEDLKQLAADSD